VRQLITVSLCFAAMPFLAHGQTTCTAATLSGTYHFDLTGRDVAGTVALTKSYQSTGTITFDGISKVTATLATNTNSAPGVPQTLGGTYAIPSNCVGTLNFSTGDTASYTLIPYDGGLDFSIVGEDATYELTGGGDQQPSTCPASTLSGTYAFSGNGFALATGAITGVNDISGLLVFDGVSAITGNWSISTSGNATSDSVSGTYKLSSGCTGSATVKDPNGVSYALSFSISSPTGSDLTVLGATATNMFTSTAHSIFTNPGVSVANAAGVTGGTPPGSLFSIYGTDLSTNNGQAITTNWPTSLANAVVTVDGEKAPLYFVSPVQINAQMPLDIAPGIATVVVTNGSTASNSVAVPVPATAQPGVFIYGANRAVAQNLTIVQGVPTYTLNSTAAPAAAGSYIVVYFTGGGPVQGGSSVVTGQPTPGGSALFTLLENFSATVAGVASPNIPFIGLTAGLIGVYQADIQIPAIAAGTHNLILTVNGVASNTTTISTN
jgi:uncharacterized protein (TIGR03437 family)